jgi:hypothetical protein
MVDLKTEDDATSPSMSDPGSIQLQLFVTLWVMAFTFHFFESTPFDAWPVILAGIPCLIVPGSFVALAAFVVVSTGVVAIHLPAASNHFIIALLVNLTLGGAALSVLLIRRKSGEDREEALNRWLQLVFTPVALTLMVVYFFGVFHKLNTSFFDSRVSCAGTLLRQGLTRQGITPGDIPEQVVLASAALTLLWEGSILICIAVPRLRRWGILLGVIFHLTLVWAEFYDFATFVFALYVLLLPRESFGRIAKVEAYRSLAIMGWMASTAVSVAADLSDSPSSPIGIRWHTIKVVLWLLTVGPIMLPLLKVNFSGGQPFAPRRWRLRPAWLLVVPLLAFFNGSTSYLGLKTVANYSMFSNLRTEEGRTNHLIGGVSALELTGTLRDTVDIHDLRFAEFELGPLADAHGSVARLRRQMRWAKQGTTVRIPWLELRRAANLWKSAGLEDVYIDYTHKGIRRELTNAAADSELSAPLPWFTRLLQAFREIERGDNPVRCRW